jgi:hypothetical protein
VTNGQPIRRGISALLASTLSGSATTAALLEAKAFHRQKHLPDADMHISCGGRGSFSGTSTLRSSFSAPDLPHKPRKYDWTATVPRGSLSGIGVPVYSLDMTNDWRSTKSAELENDTRPRTTLVERTFAAIEAGRRLDLSRSTTSHAFASSSDLYSTAVTLLTAKRHSSAEDS